jgi:hypothetical protein
VAEEAGLHVLRPQRLGQQRVVQEVDLSDREVVGRPPPGVETIEIGRGNSLSGFGLCHVVSKRLSR